MNRIEAIKKRRRLSYGDIADRAGVSTQYIFLLAKGRRTNPSFDVMQKIAAALGEKVEKVFLINNRGLS